MIYFFDEAAVAAAHNLEPVPGPVEKLGTVLEPDRPSDGKRCMSFANSIMPLEDGRWRMYYGWRCLQCDRVRCVLCRALYGRL